MDHPFTIKRGVVCIHYKDSLVVKMINLLLIRMLWKITLEDILISKSGVQTLNIFFLVLNSYLSILKALSLTVVLDEYNTRSRSWWAFNINKPEGMQLDAQSPSYGVQQLVTEPTHILPNSSSSMDLIFTDQPSMVFNSFSSC